MAANRAPSSRASLASSAALPPEATASTRYMLSACLITSAVLAPIDPVAPRIVTRLSAAGVAWSDWARGRCMAQVLPHQEAACRGFRTPAQHAQDGRHERGRDKAVQAVHQPAMAGDEPARVLGAVAALERGLEQITGLRGGRE